MSERSTIGTIVVLEQPEPAGAEDVCLGRQPALQRDVVLKRLRGGLEAAPDRVERFQREARFGAAVIHPNLVQLFDCFAFEGDHYLVMERVDGPTLAEALEDAGRPPHGAARCIAVEVARALAELHSRRVVHGDLRPEHVLLSRRGEVKLTGLGSASHEGEERVPVPTPDARYAAPELLRGEAATTAADVFALGSLILALHSPAELSQRSLAPRLLALARRCRAQRPERRPSAPELIDSLAGRRIEGSSRCHQEVSAWLLGLSAARARPEGRWWAEVRGPRWRPLAGAGLAGAALAVGAYLALSGRSVPEPSSAAPTPPVEAGPPPAQAPPVTPALVRFVAHPWAEIRVDERAPFTTPRAEPLELEPGSHEVTFAHPRYGTARRTIVVEPGAQRLIRHVFAPPEAP